MNQLASAFDVSPELFKKVLISLPIIALLAWLKVMGV